MNNLKGKHILLRAVEPEDAQIIFDWENNEQNWQLSNTLTPFSKHTIAQYTDVAQQDIFENKQLRLMIDTLDESVTVGSIDLFDFNPFHLRAGVGILINDHSDRKKGLAKESLDLLIKYTRNTLVLRQLFCNIGESNTASIRLFESAGFIKTGVQKQWQRVSQDKWEDVFFYQLVF